MDRKGLPILKTNPFLVTPIPRKAENEEHFSNRIKNENQKKVKTTITYKQRIHSVIMERLIILYLQK